MLPLWESGKEYTVLLLTTACESVITSKLKIYMKMTLKTVASKLCVLMETSNK